jgi:hypothetical protein
MHLLRFVLHFQIALDVAQSARATPFALIDASFYTPPKAKKQDE